MPRKIQTDHTGRDILQLLRKIIAIPHHGIPGHKDKIKDKQDEANGFQRFPDGFGKEQQLRVERVKQQRSSGNHDPDGIQPMPAGHPGDIGI